jgi:histidine ammonia-lyase
VLGIELLAAARAIDSMRPLRTTPVLEQVHALVRSLAPSQPHDHRLDRGMAALTTLVQSGALTGFLR